MPHTLREKLEILRLIDKEIDFCKGVVQFDVLLALAVDSTGLTTREIAQRLNMKYKSVADAIRKMTLKGLIIKDEGRHYLSHDGKILYETLLSVLNLPRQHRYTRVLDESRDVKNLMHNMVTVNHLYEAILALGLSRKNMLDVSTLAKIMGLSTNRAEAYLDLFTQHPLRLLQKVYVDSTMQKIKSALSKLITFRRKNKVSSLKVHYLLTKRGLKVFNRLFYRVKVNKHKTYYKILASIFNTIHPRVIIRKMITFTVVFSFVVLLYSLISLFSIPIPLHISILFDVILVFTAVIIMIILAMLYSIT